jgi:hypothetical protein
LTQFFIGVEIKGYLAHNFSKDRDKGLLDSLFLGGEVGEEKETLERCKMKKETK